MTTIAELTVHIVSQYVSYNAVPQAELPTLIKLISSSLHALSNPPTEQVIRRAKPAIPINQTITPDYLICLEDGRRYKMLKRPLSRVGLTPTEYRLKWGLPLDYPMTAANYSKRRSMIAKEIGLGNTSRPA